MSEQKMLRRSRVDGQGTMVFRITEFFGHAFVETWHDKPIPPAPYLALTAQEALDRGMGWEAGAEDAAACGATPAEICTELESGE